MNFDFIPAWANVIAQQEGYNSAGSRPARNHNPGDLKFAGQAGAVGADSGGFAVFPDDVTGFQALYRQLQKYVTDFPSFTILDITAHYLGQSSPTINAQGNAFSYAQTVANGLGVDVSTTLGELAGGSPSLPVPPELTASTPGAATFDSAEMPAGPGGVPYQLPAGDFSLGEVAAVMGVIAFLAYLAWS